MVIKKLVEAFHFTCSVEFWRMGVFWTLSFILSYFRLLAQSFFSRNSKSYARCSPTLESTAVRKPICIITGATSGLGAAAASELSRKGFYVVLGTFWPSFWGLFVKYGILCCIVVLEDQLICYWRLCPKSENEIKLQKAFHLDLSSFQSVVKFKIALEQWLLDSDLHCSIQLLINNAGILATSCRFTSVGYDQMMGTNYIGAFSLTKVLLPLLEKSPIPSQIVNVSSFTHWNVSGVHVKKETVSGKSFSKSKHYPYAHIYEYSKLCLLLYSYELHRQIEIMQKSHQISVIAVDPGVVKTNIMREVPSCLSQIACLVLTILGLLQSPESGVSSIVDAALSPPEVSGVYFFGGNGRTLNSSGLSYDTHLSKELWTTSCDLFLEAQLLYKDTSICPNNF